MEISEEEILRIEKEFDEDVNWFEEHYDELREKYREFAIAIKGKKVIAYAEYLDDLIRKVEEAGYDPVEVFITGFQPDGVGIIL